MTTHIGFFRANEDYVHEQGARIRDGELVSDDVRQKVLDQFDKLPASVKPIGVYRPLTSGWVVQPTYPPGVWIAETDDPLELDFITNLWAGFIDFEWVPVQGIGSTAQDAAAAVDALVNR